MTKADIIKLAKEAGFLIDTHAQKYQPNCILSTYGLIDENLKRFAKLVVAHKAEVITAEAYRCGYKDGMEAAAVICENLPMQQDRDVRDECAASIRARGTT